MSNMSSTVRDSLTRFCQLELELQDASKEHMVMCAPSNSARTRSYDVLTRVMVEDATPWLSLSGGGYLHYHTVNSQCTLKESIVKVAVSAALRNFRKNPGATIEDARTNLLNFVKKEVRAHRTASSVSVKYVTKLPHKVDVGNIPPASEYISTTAKTWMDAKKTLACKREQYMERVETLQRDREDALNATGVREYLTGISGGGQPVSLVGRTQKFKLSHNVSTRRNPIREKHVQEALSTAVEQTLVNKHSTVSVEDLTKLIMDEALRLAGSETRDVFSLTAQRGRKRAAGDE